MTWKSLSHDASGLTLVHLKGVPVADRTIGQLSPRGRQNCRLKAHHTALHAGTLVIGNHSLHNLDVFALIALSSLRIRNLTTEFTRIRCEEGIDATSARDVAPLAGRVKYSCKALVMGDRISKLRHTAARNRGNRSAQVFWNRLLRGRVPSQA
jgi:hypothetical protein